MSIYDYVCYTHDGQRFNLGALQGQVLLVVNVASQCGFTPQLKELETFFQRYRDRGFTVLGFPCNQFGRQTPENAEAFAVFAQREFSVEFPLMEKVNVNGRDAHPLFAQLKNEAPGVMGTKTIKWNFTKFLVGRDGHAIARFGPKAHGAELKIELERALDTE